MEAKLAETGGPAVRISGFPQRIKRLSDVVAAGVGFVLIGPLMLGIAALVRWRMGPPALFTQPRLGRDERPFLMYKFRTMTDRREPDGNLLPDSERLTPLGAWLRKLSLDELPQFWNVLRGDMSLVGPRPLYVEYAPYYSERERLRHRVRPGITGLAQVNGRNWIYWDERLELDAQYVESWSLGLDLRILLKTVRKVIAREDVAVVPRKTGVPLNQYRAGRVPVAGSRT